MSEEEILPISRAFLNEQVLSPTEGDRVKQRPLAVSLVETMATRDLEEITNPVLVDILARALTSDDLSPEKIAEVREAIDYSGASQEEIAVTLEALDRLGRDKRRQSGSSASTPAINVGDIVGEIKEAVKAGVVEGLQAGSKTESKAAGASPEWFDDEWLRAFSQRFEAEHGRPLSSRGREWAQRLIATEVGSQTLDGLEMINDWWLEQIAGDEQDVPGGGLRQRYRRVEQLVAETPARLTRLEQRIAGLETERARLRQQAADNRLAGNEHRASELEEEADQRDDQVVKLTREYQRLEDDYTRAREQAAELQQRLDEALAIHDEIQTRLTEMKLELEGAMSDIRQYNKYNSIDDLIAIIHRALVQAESEDSRKIGGIFEQSIYSAVDKAASLVKSPRSERDKAKSPQQREEEVQMLKEMVEIRVALQGHMNDLLRAGGAGEMIGPSQKINGRILFSALHRFDAWMRQYRPDEAGGEEFITTQYHQIELNDLARSDLSWRRNLALRLRQITQLQVVDASVGNYRGLGVLASSYGGLAGKVNPNAIAKLSHQAFEFLKDFHANAQLCEVLSIVDRDTGERLSLKPAELDAALEAGRNLELAEVPMRSYIATFWTQGDAEPLIFHNLHRVGEENMLALLQNVVGRENWTGMISRRSTAEDYARYRELSAYYSNVRRRREEIQRTGRLPQGKSRQELMRELEELEVLERRFGDYVEVKETFERVSAQLQSRGHTLGDVDFQVGYQESYQDEFGLSQQDFIFLREVVWQRIRHNLAVWEPRLNPKTGSLVLMPRFNIDASDLVNLGEWDYRSLNPQAGLKSLYDAWNDAQVTFMRLQNDVVRKKRFPELEAAPDIEREKGVILYKEIPQWLEDRYGERRKRMNWLIDVMTRRQRARWEGTEPERRIELVPEIINALYIGYDRAGQEKRVFAALGMPGTRWDTLVQEPPHPWQNALFCLHFQPRRVAPERIWASLLSSSRGVSASGESKTLQELGLNFETVLAYTGRRPMRIEELRFGARESALRQARSRLRSVGLNLNREELAELVRYHQLRRKIKRAGIGNVLDLRRMWLEEPRRLYKRLALDAADRELLEVVLARESGIKLDEEGWGADKIDPEQRAALDSIFSSSDFYVFGPQHVKKALWNLFFPYIRQQVIPRMFEERQRLAGQRDFGETIDLDELYQRVVGLMFDQMYALGPDGVRGMPIQNKNVDWLERFLRGDGADRPHLKKRKNPIYLMYDPNLAFLDVRVKHSVGWQRRRVELDPTLSWYKDGVTQICNAQKDLAIVKLLLTDGEFDPHEVRFWLRLLGAQEEQVKTMISEREDWNIADIEKGEWRRQEAFMLERVERAVKAVGLWGRGVSFFKQLVRIRSNMEFVVKTLGAFPVGYGAIQVYSWLLARKLAELSAQGYGVGRWTGVPTMLMVGFGAIMLHSYIFGDHVQPGSKVGQSLMEVFRRTKASPDALLYGRARLFEPLRHLDRMVWPFSIGAGIPRRLVDYLRDHNIEEWFVKIRFLDWFYKGVHDDEVDPERQILGELKEYLKLKPVTA
jgi:hypothetical protein